MSPAMCQTKKGDILSNYSTAGPKYIAKGRKEIMIIPTANKPTARMAIPVHLGLVIKAKELSNIDVQLSKLVKSTG